MPATEPRLLDLRAHARPELLAAFIELYTQTFTDPAEREDPAQWPPRLYGEQPPPQPRMHLLVAVAEQSPTPELQAGLAFEYYRESRCGLLTYLVTDPAHRRRGLARRLVARAIELLREDARAGGDELRAVFAEAEDPEQVTHSAAMAPRARLAALARLGARRVDVAYVQPRLEGGSEPCRHLLLLAFPPNAPRPDARPAERIDGAVLHDFLHEFYRALGIARPEQDADFRAMHAGPTGPVALTAVTY